MTVSQIQLRKQEVVKVVDPKSAVETEPGPPKVKKERPKAPVAVESDSDEPQASGLSCMTQFIFFNFACKCD